MNIPKIVHESWHPILQPLFDDYKMGMVLDTVSKSEYYPSKENVFRVFAMPIDKIKVVILGQDPYPNGEGTGLAFAVKPYKNTPTSLRIIKDEALKTVYNNDYSIFEKSSYSSLVDWKTLEHWWKQGVFLMNTALTVEKKNAGSHLTIWEWFSRIVIAQISRQAHPVWLLWGAKAKAYRSYLVNPMNYVEVWQRTEKTKEEKLSDYNVILEAPHPAAEAYDPNTTYKFSGCNHFNLCNEILKNKGEKEIVW